MTEKNPTQPVLTLEEQRELELKQRKAKFLKFAKLWVSTSKLSSTMYETPDENDVSVAFADLGAYSLEDIKIALAKFRKMPERRLSPAIIESLITGVFWVSSDEAWGLAQKSFDSTRSVWILSEILSAAHEVRELYFSGQKTAAKQSFERIYERHMISSRKKPHWFLCQAEGSVDLHTANRDALNSAVSQGILSHEKAMAVAKVYGVEWISQNKPDLNNLIKNAPETIKLENGKTINKEEIVRKIKSLKLSLIEESQND